MIPDDIRKKEFSRRFRGFDTQEVQAFLDKIADNLEGLEKSMLDQHRQIQTAQEEIAAFRGREKSLEATLAQTRKMSEDIKANAEREAQVIVAEAELQAEKILGQAHGRLAQIHDDISELKRQRTQFEVRLRSLVEAHLKLLDLELDRDRDLAELEDKIKILRTTSS